MHECFVCLILPSGSHNLNFLRNKCHGFMYRQTSAFPHEKTKYNLVCVQDEESISDMLNEELDIDSDDEMNMENEGQSWSEESRNASSESECESETSAVY
jgi:hypothetical protein